MMKIRWTFRKHILESEQLSDAAKNIYIYFIYLITENVEDVLDALSRIDEAKKDLEPGLGATFSLWIN